MEILHQVYTEIHFKFYTAVQLRVFRNVDADSHMGFFVMWNFAVFSKYEIQPSLELGNLKGYGTGPTV